MIRRILLAVTAFAASIGCTDTGLGAAQLVNVQDTIVLGALTGSSLALPAGFSAPEAIVVHTDISSGFDFVYEVLPDHRHVFMPLAAIGLAVANGANPGLLKATQAFDDVVSAPNKGYSTTDSLTIAAGDVIVVRSRIACSLGVPQYAKLHILSFDEAARSVRIAVLGDINCGYRGLEPGIPVR